MEIYDNFSFLKRININIYQHIHTAEKKILTDAEGSANSLRKAMELEMRIVAQSNGIKFEGPEKSLGNMIIKLREKGLLPELGDMYKIKDNLGVYCDDEYDFLRKIGNSGSHALDGKKSITTYKNLVTALKVFRDMAKTIHHIEGVGEFDEKRMYIENYAIYEVERIPEWDKSGCIWQYKAYGIDEEEGEINQYAIIRQYTKKSFRPLILRSMKLYNEAIKMSEKGMPYGLTQMRELTQYSSDNDYYIIAYEFYKGEPQKLSSVLKEMSYADRINLSKMIIQVIKDMHDFEYPIYHRLLNPDCVYVCKKDNDYIPYIVNFSYAKVSNSSLTVKGQIPDAKEARSYGIYCKYLAPEYNSYNFDEDISNEIWEKIDLYALGVLIADILVGNISAKVIQYDDLLDNDIPEELAEMVSLLHSEDPGDRLGLDSLLGIM